MASRPLTAPILCLVTAGTGALDFTYIRTAALAGIDLVQIRERAVDDRTLFALVRGALDAVAGTCARVVVNDRLDVALAAGADGVHLRADSIAAADARTIAPDGFVVGRSVHSVVDAIEAERGGGCDYLLFGTVFPTASKPAGHRVAGVDELARVCGAVGVPVLAIGGITETNAPSVARAGAAGVAAITLFAAAEGVESRVRAVRRSFDTCYPQPK